MDTKTEKTLLHRAYLFVPLLAIIMALSILTVASAAAGSAAYYLGCATSVVSFAAVCGYLTYTLDRLVKLGSSDVH